MTTRKVLGDALSDDFARILNVEITKRKLDVAKHNC